MLKKLLENLRTKREEKLKDKPQYEISNLRTAKIVRLENKTPTNQPSKVESVLKVVGVCIMTVGFILIAIPS